MGNLNLLQLTAAQDNKTVTINDIADDLDLALTDIATIDVDNTNARTITAVEWTQNILFNVTNGSPNPNDAITVTTPATIRGFVLFLNSTLFNVSVQSSGQTLDPVLVLPGEVRAVFQGGTNIRPATQGTVQATGAITGFVPRAFQGALVTKTSTQNINTSAIINWDTATYDTSGFYSGVNPSRLTVPVGVTRVRLTASVNFASGGGQAFIQLRKNGAGVTGGPAQDSDTAGEETESFSSAVLEVSPGDYFDITATVGAARDVAVSASTFFAIEVVETTDSANLTSQVVTLPPRFSGAVAQNAADLTTQNYSAGAVVTWDTDTIDTDAFHDTGSNTERLTIPGGVTKVRLGANVRLNDVTVGNEWSMRIRKNAADFPGGSLVARMTTSTVVEGSINTPVVDVVAGDYFDVFVDTEIDTSVTVDALGSAFWIEVVERTNAAAATTAFLATKVKHEGFTIKSNTAQSLTTGVNNQVEFDSAVLDTKHQPNDTGPPQRFWLGADQTFVDANVNTGTDRVTVTGHGFTTGEGPVRLSNSGGALPTGLNNTTDYWIIVVDANTLEFALSRANALASTQVDITAAAGGGTHTIETETWAVVPAGVTKMRFTLHTIVDGVTGDLLISLREGGGDPGSLVEGGIQVDFANASDPDHATATSAIIEVTEGERYEFDIVPNGSGITLNASNLDTYMSGEVIETDATLAFAGVSVTPPVMGALVRADTQVGVDFSGAQAGTVDFANEIYDTHGFHDNATNPSRITIPANLGIRKARFTYNLVLGAVPSGEWIRTILIKNGSVGFIQGGADNLQESTQTAVQDISCVTSSIIDVADNDYFEVYLAIETDDTIDISSVSTFSIEVVETDESAEPPEPCEVYLDTADWNGAAFPTSNPVFKKIAVRRFSLNDNFSGSVGQADAGPNGGAVAIDVQRNGSSIGSINFADSTGAAQTATFTTSGATQEDFEIGDRLELVAPANWQSMDEVVISLWAFRT